MQNDHFGSESTLAAHIRNSQDHRKTSLCPLVPNRHDVFAGTAGGESTYGLQTFSGTYTTAQTTNGQTYRVDTYTNRPSFSAFEANAAQV